jgi:hypothetical protein
VTVPISELVDISASMHARFNALFETLGRWVASTGDPAVQQRFAQAAHRHAWHADLWAERRPTIPLDAGPSAQLDEVPDDPAASVRLAWYVGQVERLRAELGELSGRIDPVLDPSTARVISLITHDLN